jgi:periplasmic copper chaperone A
MRPRPLRTITALALVALVSACARHLGASGRVGGISVTDAVAWGFPGSGSLTVGCRITSSVPDSLVAVTTPVAAHAQLHNVVTNQGISRMIAVPVVPLPAHTTVRLGAGGYHVMLDSLLANVVAGDSVEVTWEFAGAGKLTLRVPVVKFGDAQELLTP